MSSTPEDLYNQAGSLASGKSEADWRCATSRAYYSMFHTAKTFVDFYAPEFPPNSPRMGSHQEIAARLRASAGGAKALSYELVRRKKMRVVADYDIDGHFDRTMATSQVEAAALFAAKVAIELKGRTPIPGRTSTFKPRMKV